MLGDTAICAAQLRDIKAAIAVIDGRQFLEAAEGLRSTISQLEDRLERAEEQYAESTARIESADAEIVEAELEADAEQEKLREARSKIEQLDSAREASQRRAEELQIDADGCAERVAELEGQRSRRREELGTGRDELANLEANVIELHKRLEQLQEESKTARRQVGELEEARERSREQVLEWLHAKTRNSNIVHDQEVQKRSATAALERLETRLADLDVDRAGHRSELDERRTELAEVTTKITDVAGRERAGLDELEGADRDVADLAAGAKVVVNDLGGSVDGTGGSSEAANKVVEEIKAAGGEAIANGASVSDRAGAESIIKDAVDAFGTVDILVNNAGILRDKSFAKGTLEDFELVLSVHLLGSTYVTKAAWPVMAEKGYGRIIMTTSSSGLYGNFGQSNYGAAKLGLVGLMNTLKLEGERKGIKVNCIAPVAATRMTENLGIPEAVFSQLKPELVTPAVLYLSSDDAPTGCIIEAGAGAYSKVAIVEAKGVKLGPEATLESFAENFDKICDMSEARELSNGGEATMKIFSG